MWSNWEHTPTIARSRPQMKEAVETDQSQQSWRLSTAVRDKTVTALADARIISDFLFSFIRALENTVSAPKAILIPGLHAKHWPGNIFSTGFANEHN